MEERDAAWYQTTLNGLMSEIAAANEKIQRLQTDKAELRTTVEVLRERIRLTHAESSR